MYSRFFIRSGMTVHHCVRQSLNGNMTPLRMNLSLSADVLRARLNEFQDLFVEARLCIEDATESLETTYFEADLAEAKTNVDAAVDAYKALLAEADENQRGEIDRANGMKVKQLEAEFKSVAETYLHE